MLRITEHAIEAFCFIKQLCPWSELNLACNAFATIHLRRPPSVSARQHHKVSCTHCLCIDCRWLGCAHNMFWSSLPFKSCTGCQFKHTSLLWWSWWYGTMFTQAVNVQVLSLDVYAWFETDLGASLVRVHATNSFGDCLSA